MFPSFHLGRAASPIATSVEAQSADTNPPPHLELIHTANYADEDKFPEYLDRALAAGVSIELCDVDGKNLLEIAVERNSAAMVKALLLHDAPLPLVGQSQFDLLMQASHAGNLEIVTALLEGGGMVADESDATGQTALHYAVRSGCSDIIELLIENGADVGALAFHVPDTDLTQLFGLNHGLAGTGISPLSIAVAQDDLRNVKLLLSHHGMIPPGMRNPLWVAVQRQNAAVLIELLEHCQRTHQTGLIEYSLLHSAIMRSPQPQLVKILLGHLQNPTPKPAALTQALHTAMTLGHFDQATELINAGTLSGASSVAIDMLWAAASMHHDATARDLLTVTREAPFLRLIHAYEHGHPLLFSRLCHLASDPTALAQEGVFGSVVSNILPALNSLARQVNDLTPAQIAAKTAHLLFKTQSSRGTNQWAALLAPTSLALVPGTGGSPASAQAVNSIATTLIEEIRAARQRDIDRLTDVVMEAMLNSLGDVLSPETVQQLQQLVGDNGIGNALMQRLRVEHGVPNFIAQSMASAWNDACNVNASPYAGLDLMTVCRLTSLTLYCSLQSAATDTGSVSDFCKAFLIEKLTPTREPLQELVRQPAAFIRSLAQRQEFVVGNWAPLATVLRHNTGLPRDVCQNLAVCWHNANMHIPNERGHSSADNIRRLEHSFASQWISWYDANAHLAGSAALPLTQDELAQMTDWCIRALAVPLVSRKRPAEHEPSDAPPPKPPKQH